MKQHLQKYHASNLSHRPIQETLQEQVATSQPTPGKTTQKSTIVSDDSTGPSPNLLPTIFAAASAGNTILLQQLCHLGIDMHAIADDGCNALHTAARAGKEQAAKYLMELGVSPDLRNRAYRFPVAEAALSGSWETLRLFLQDDQERLPNMSYNVLKSGNHDMIRNWVNYHGQHNNRDRKLEVIHAAASTRGASAMRFIISHGGYNVNDKYSQGPAPIHSAAQNDDAEILRLLISHPDIDVNLTTSSIYGPFMRTPLQIAIRYGNRKTFEILLADSRIQWKDRGSWPQQELRTCIAFRRYKMGSFLIENYWPGERDAKYHLLCASIRGEEDKIRQLESDGDFIATARYQNGYLEPLIWAMVMGHFGVTKLLLKRLDFNADQFESSFLPLDVATRSGDKEMLSLLLNHPKTLPSEGKPLYYAVKANHTDMVEKLLLHQINTRRGYPLYLAIRHRSLPILGLLLNDERFDVNENRGWDGTPLICAVREDSVELVQLIFARRISPRVRVNDTFRLHPFGTALDFAYQRNHSAIIEFLRSHGAKTYKELKDSESSSHISAGPCTDTTNTLEEPQGHSQSALDAIDPRLLMHGRSIFNAAPIQDATPMEQSLLEMEDEDTENCLGEDFNMEDWPDKDHDTQGWYQEGSERHDWSGI